MSDGAIRKMTIVERGGKCVPLTKGEDETWSGGGYEIMQDEDHKDNFIINNDENTWEIFLRFTPYTTNDAYIKLGEDVEATVSTKSGTDEALDKFYEFRCEGKKLWIKRIADDLKNTYAQLNGSELDLPSDEECFNRYSANIEKAEKIVAAAKRGDFEYVQRALGLSDSQLSEDNIVNGFRTLFMPPKCDNAPAVDTPAEATPSAPPAKASAPEVSPAPPAPAASAPPPTAPSVRAAETKDPSSEKFTAVLREARVIDAVLDIANYKNRQTERKAGTAKNFERPMLRGGPLPIPIAATYTSWVSFSVSPYNPQESLNTVITNLTSALKNSAAAHGADLSLFRIVIISQHSTDNTKTAVDRTEKLLKQNGFLVGTLHQNEPVYPVADVMGTEESILSSDREKLANTITISVIPAKAYASEEQLLDYYRIFLERQEESLMILSGKLKGEDFSNEQ